jgi:hypothetical protein
MKPAFLFGRVSRGVGPWLVVSGRDSELVGSQVAALLAEWEAAELRRLSVVPGAATSFSDSSAPPVHSRGPRVSANAGEGVADVERLRALARSSRSRLDFLPAVVFV